MYGLQDCFEDQVEALESRIAQLVKEKDSPIQRALLAELRRQLSGVNASYRAECPDVFEKSSVLIDDEQ